jgi:hypothetical protein
VGRHRPIDRGAAKGPLRIAAACVVVAGLLASIGGAKATTPTAGSRSFAYWFYTGNIPTSSGDRAVRKQNDCCNNSQWIRMSWQTGTHDMNFLNIDYAGNWSSVRAYASNGYDQYLLYNATAWRQGGCQNPLGLSTVWTNCHEGNTA